ncbi:MAG: hypothetical protein WC779_03685 [Candidatus Omnitrophota bacterium]|jgi:hypothetical protein
MNNAPRYGTPPSFSANTTGKSKKVGPIVVALVVVLILVIVALYMFASRIDKQNVLPADNASALNAAANGNQAAAMTPEIVTPVTNTANDPQSLQTDLNASIKGVDAQTF